MAKLMYAMPYKSNSTGKSTGPWILFARKGTAVILSAKVGLISQQDIKRMHPVMVTIEPVRRKAGKRATK